jgi:tetratricopeptide (TPR) repeat protein
MSLPLDPLRPEQCRALVTNLLATDSVDEAVRERIAAVAEGNPLYAEEITGLLVDEGRLVSKEGRWVATGDLSDLPVPPTISALLAARLDRLPSQERRLIEIGSVMGQVFYSSAVRELAATDPVAVDDALASLVSKQFVRPARSDVAATDALEFRHLLIRDAAYESIPKVGRAVLHERFAGWYADSARAVGEQDELLGYHLEQAYRLLSELGPVTDRAMKLGRRAGEHLAEAGLRAVARGDYLAATGLMGRAVSILPSDHAQLPMLEGRLFNAFLEIGDYERATGANVRQLTLARAIGDRGQEQRAEIGALELRQYRSPQDVTTEECDRIAHRAVDVFERLGDEEGLCLAHFVLSETSFRNGRVTEAQPEAELALMYGLRSHASVLLTYAVSSIAGGLFFGPTPAGAALDRVERLVEQVVDFQSAKTDAQALGAWFLAYLGRFDEARERARQQLEVYEDLGNKGAVAWTVSTLGRIDWLAGDPEAAEPGLRSLCEVLRAVGDDWNLADSTCDLCELFLALGRENEVPELIAEIQSMIAPDELWKQTRWRTLQSVALARAGQIKDAMPLMVEAEQLVRTTELTTTLANTMLAKAEVLKLADHQKDAASAAREALALYEVKEFAPHIGWARAMLDSLS